MAVALPVGTRIGGFDVADVIGRGGFGITYRAADGRSGRTYAIKEYVPDGLSQRAEDGRVSPTKGADQTYQRGLNAFMQEANILKMLPRRKGLVRVRGAFEKFGTAYCVMEFIEGDSLDRMAWRILDRQGHIPEDLIKELAVSVCWALDALHAQNLIHRDVKPANIMIRRNGEPVLIDFGAARQLTRRGAKETIFTRKYAAIEQFPPEMSGFGRSFDEGPWSDLYSLSALLYELIAKEPPPDASTRAKAVLGGADDPYRPLITLDAAAAYSPDLLKAIDDGCALLPKERIATARDFAQRISPGKWASLEVDLAARTRDTTELEMGTGTERRPLPWLWIAVLALGLGLFALWLRRNAPQWGMF